MRRARGFTLLEMVFAFGLLVIAITASSVLVASLGRHQAVLWEDAIAGELALSVLEQAMAEPRLDPTPPQGRTIVVAPGPGGTPLLPEIQAVLLVRSVPERTDVVDVSAKVIWRCAGITSSGDHKTIERTTRRRVTR